MDRFAAIQGVVNRVKLVNRIKLAASFCLIAASGLAYQINYQDFNQAPSILPLVLLLLAVALFVAAFLVAKKQP